MKNRIPTHLAAPEGAGLAPQPAVQDVRDRVQEEIADRIRQVENIFHAHPGIAIGAAFCLGAFLGWVIKQK